MATKITRKPSPKPANLRMALATENNNASVMAEWGVPADALWESNHQWSSLDEYWDFNASKDMSKTRVQQRGDGHAMADLVWVRDKGADHSSNTMWYNRANYHPRTLGRYLNSVTCQLRAGNGKGFATVSKTLTLQKPPKPNVEVEFDSDPGILTWTLTRPELSGNQEMYDMQYYVTRQDKNWNSNYVNETRDGQVASSSQDEVIVTRNNWAGQIPNDAFIRWRLKAVSRGVKGDSAETVSQFVYAHPARAQILKITFTGWHSDDMVCIKIRTNHNANERPVDTVKLQRLWNTSITSAASAWQSNDWEYVEGAVDDAQCSGFCDLMYDAKPTVGKHTWYRLVTEHAGFTMFSEAVMAKCINHSNSRLDNDKVRFATIGSGVDGESVDMLIAWKNDDSTSTEVAWSTHENAWQSNDQPESMTITWEDSSSQVSGWAHSAHVTIRGINQDEPLYVRARRVLDEGVESPQYAPWCYPGNEGEYPITPSIAPTDVVLMVPESVERGHGINCMWTYSGGEQTDWAVYDNSVTPPVILASGTGSDGGCVIPASLLNGKTKVDLSVAVTTGGNTAVSDIVTVSIMDRPTLSVSVAQSLTAQPLVVTLIGDSSVASVRLWVTSHGVGPNNPMSNNDQPAGDILWATSVQPNWATADGGETWSAEVTAPANLDFRKGAGYTVAAVSTVGGLSSDEATDDFVIAWSHQAVAPDSESSVVVNASDRTATIIPIAPSGAQGTDVCDIYRETPDGFYLIAEGVPFGSSVVDPYAPFSNLPNAVTAYLLCTRTIDGDIEWREIEYEMKVSVLRIDWDGTSVELPYSVTHTTGFEKQAEVQRRLNGSMVGEWDIGAARTEQITLDLARNEMWSEARLIRQIGRYSGPCFVRSHDGCAYEADVQVDSMELAYGATAIPVSLRIREIDLTDEFRQQQTNAEDGE